MNYDPDFGLAPAKATVRSPIGLVDRPPIASWRWVYLANLPIPAYLGFHVAYGPGLIGMGLGGAGLYAAGRWMCRVNPRAIWMVSYGGWLVAAVQVCPIPQIIAGMMGVCLAGLLTQEDAWSHEPLTATGGLIATTATGLALMALAGAFGFFFLGLRYALSPSLRAGVDGDGPRSP